MKRYIKSAVKSVSDENLEDQRSFINDPNTSPDMLRQLFEGRNASYWREDYYICLDLAKSPNTPIDILKQLSDREFDSNIRRCVAENPSTPADILVDMYNDGVVVMDVMYAIAGNPNTPSDLLDTLSMKHTSLEAFKSDFDRLRAYVASNPNTAPDTLDYLAYDDSPYVRWTVAANPNTPIDALKRLLEDDNVSVQDHLGKNPNINKVLKELGV